MPDVDLNTPTEGKTPLWAELVKLLLPLTVGMVGVYVGQVVAPLDSQIQELKADVAPIASQISTLTAHQIDLIRRVTTCEGTMDNYRDHFSNELRALQREVDKVTTTVGINHRGDKQ